MGDTYPDSDSLLFTLVTQSISQMPHVFPSSHQNHNASLTRPLQKNKNSSLQDHFTTETPHDHHIAKGSSQPTPHWPHSKITNTCQ